MGISGAALAASISYTILAIMWIWFYTRETAVSWKALVPSSSDLIVYTALWRRAAARVS
jgi:Na+-driven multidrug efflux pump